MVRPRALVGVLLVASVGMTSSAAAKRSPWHMQLEVATDFPLLIGGHATFEMPAGLQVSTGLGHLFQPYVDVIDAVARGYDAYAEETANLVRTSLRDSFVWRIHGGWRPLSEFGLYVEAGYRLVSVSSEVRGGDMVTILDDSIRDLFDESATMYSLYQVESTLHMIDFEVGWRWVLDSGWSFRVAVGLAATAHGQTGVQPIYSSLTDEENAIVTEGTRAHLNAIYLKHVHSPVLSFGLGHRFY